MIRRLLLSVLFLLPLSAFAIHPAGSAEAMAQLRDKALQMKWSDLRTDANDGGNVFGVVMDWPLSGNIVTVVALESGDASIFTTGNYGMTGGILHETIRSAAKELVAKAEGRFDDAVPTADLSYPEPGTVRFFLLTASGLRRIDYPWAQVQKKGGAAYTLFDRAQEVITAFRVLEEQGAAGQL
jgi:hypothetical protein